MAADKLWKESVDFQGRRIQKRKNNKNSAIIGWDQAMKERLANKSIFTMSRSDSRFMFHGPDHNAFKATLIIAFEQEALVLSTLGDADKGMKLNYGETALDLLDSVDRGILPPALSSLLPETQNSQFYDGAVIVEVRDRRLTPALCLQRVILRPTTRSILADMHELLAQKPPALATPVSNKGSGGSNYKGKNVTSDPGKAVWTAESVHQLEATMTLNRAKALCLNPSPIVFCVNNRLHYNARKFNTQEIYKGRRKYLREWLLQSGIRIETPADVLADAMAQSNQQRPGVDKGVGTDIDKTPTLQSLLLRQRQTRLMEKRKVTRKWYDPLETLTTPPTEYNLTQYPAKALPVVEASKSAGAYPGRTIKCESRTHQTHLSAEDATKQQQQQRQQAQSKQPLSKSQTPQRASNPPAGTHQAGIHQNTLSTVTVVEMKPSQSGVYEGALKHVVRGNRVGTIGAPVALPFSLGLHESAEATMKQFRRMFMIEKNKILSDEKDHKLLYTISGKPPPA